MLLATADTGHDAERAVVVTALDHAHEVADASPPRLRHRLAIGVVVARLEIADEGLVVADGDDRIEMWEAALELLALFGDDAARHRNCSLRRLPLLELVQLGVHPVLGRLPDDARVQDRNVRPFERVFDVARGEQPSSQALGIRGVHLATDRPDVERPGLDAWSPLPRSLSPTRRVCLSEFRYRLSTSKRIPVRSSPSIEMSIKAGMQTRSSPPGAT